MLTNVCFFRWPRVKTTINEFIICLTVSAELLYDWGLGIKPFGEIMPYWLIAAMCFG